MRLLFSLATVVLTGGIASAGSISLTGTEDLVAFNGNDNVITLGENCPGGICTYSGSQVLGGGTLKWKFLTPDNESIIWDPFGGVTGPTGGTFHADDPIDSFDGTYTISSWNYDGVPDSNGNQGIDLSGLIVVTNVALSGSDPNDAAFQSFWSLPGATSYNFVLDVGNCVSGSKAKPCILPSDPSASFISLTLNPNVSSTPEPATLALVGAGLAGIATLRRKRRAS